MQESVTVSDPLALSLLSWLLKHLQPGDCITGISIHRFRVLFKKVIAFFELGEAHFAPYSIRRGGATFEFHTTGSMDQVLVKGRWAIPKQPGSTSTRGPWLPLLSS